MKKSESKGINSIAIMKNTEDEILLKKKPYIDWLSGLIGGFVSVSCCAPLDLARTRHMVIVNYQKIK